MKFCEKNRDINKDPKTNTYMCYIICARLANEDEFLFTQNRRNTLPCSYDFQIKVLQSEGCISAMVWIYNLRTYSSILSQITVNLFFEKLSIKTRMATSLRSKVNGKERYKVKKTCKLIIVSENPVYP